MTLEYITLAQPLLKDLRTCWSS